MHASVASPMQSHAEEVAMGHAHALGRKLFLVPLLALAPACASPRTGTTEVRGADVHLAEDAPAAAAARAGAHRHALTLADHAVATRPEAPWPRYHRAVALKNVGEIDEAAKAYREAEARFGPGDVRAKSIAIYGRARAFGDAGRCDEARAAYRDYAALTRPYNRAAADMALVYGQRCRELEPFVGGQAMTTAVTAIVEGEHLTALTLLDRLPAPSRESGWYAYNRGVALAGLGRTERAIESFAAAEERFGDDDRGAALAIYGRARALDAAGRCDEAAGDYGAYAERVRAREPVAARTAEQIASACGEPLTDRTAGEDRPVPR
jgi:tetratricopeptide (TPR) repeat protein